MVEIHRNVRNVSYSNVINHPSNLLNTMILYHVHNAHTIVFVYNAWIKALSLWTVEPERENNTARVITQLGRDN